MPVKITGLVPHNLSTLSEPRPGSDFDLDGIARFARAHEEGGFDRVLIANAAVMPDSFALGTHVTELTERLGVMMAHRPGFIAPTMAARMLATIDRLSGGRAAVHIIAGASDVELQADGDFLTKDERYHRAGEYVDIMRRVWASAEPFDHDGAYYKLRGASAMVRPERGAIEVFWGGESDLAIELAGCHADVYAMTGDTLAGIGGLVTRANAAAARAGRTLDHLVTLVVVMAGTEDAAWARAERFREGAIAQKARNFGSESKAMTGKDGRPVAKAFSRILDRAAEGERLDKCLWTGMNKAMEGRGNNTTLVGTPDQIVDALLDYYRLGVSRFLLRGYDMLDDAAAIGRDLIPLLRHRADEIDRMARREVPA